jgi:hypothetical protein
MSATGSGSVFWVDAKESLQIYVGHDPELDPEPDLHVLKVRSGSGQKLPGFVTPRQNLYLGRPDLEPHKK